MSAISYLSVIALYQLPISYRFLSVTYRLSLPISYLSVNASYLPERLDEILVGTDPSLRPEIAEADSRAATVKQRPTSRRITQAEINVSHLGPSCWPPSIILLILCACIGETMEDECWNSHWCQKWEFTLVSEVGNVYHTHVQFGRFRWNVAQWFDESLIMCLFLQSLLERQGISPHAISQFHGEKSHHISLHHGMSRTKSVGKSQNLHTLHCIAPLRVNSLIAPLGWGIPTQTSTDSFGIPSLSSAKVWSHVRPLHFHCQPNGAC